MQAPGGLGECLRALAALPAAERQRLLQDCARALAGEGDEAERAWQGHAAAWAGACCALTTAARDGLTEAQLRERLAEEFQLHADAAAAAAAAYGACAPALRAKLKRYADHSPLPQLAGCSWRLDATRSEEEGDVGELFHVHVATTTKGQRQGIDLRMSTPQLQHMVGRLREALNAVERGVAA